MGEEVNRHEALGRQMREAMPAGWTRLGTNETMRSGDMSWRVGSERYLTIDESDVGKPVGNWGYWVIRFTMKGEPGPARDDGHPAWGWWRSAGMFEEAVKLHQLGMDFDNIMERLKDVTFFVDLTGAPLEAAVEICMDTTPGFTALLDRRTASVTWDLCVRQAARAGAR
jgi:hypothetical protein